MVVLNKIYTKTGDDGETALGNGTRVAKHSMRVNAYGTVDELNATVGVARLHADGKKEDIGKIVPVKINKSNRSTLFGEKDFNSNQKVA